MNFKISFTPFCVITRSRWRRKRILFSRLVVQISRFFNYFNFRIFFLNSIITLNKFARKIIDVNVFAEITSSDKEKERERQEERIPRERERKKEREREKERKKERKRKKECMPRAMFSRWLCVKLTYLLLRSSSNSIYDVNSI